VFVSKNRLGRFQFRDQGVGGSNPLSPTNTFYVYGNQICPFSASRKYIQLNRFEDQRRHGIQGIKQKVRVQPIAQCAEASFPRLGLGPH